MKRELIAYLRQRAELGEKQVFLDSLERGAAVRLLAGLERATRAEAAPIPAPAPSKGRAALAEVMAASGADSGLDSVASDVAPAQGHAHGTGIAAIVRERGPIGPDRGRALTVLREDVVGCTRCRLSETRTQVVFGDGTVEAEVMVVGEAPGADEDRTGVPFVGKAGRMLDLLLAAVGFPRERVYICNVLKCRPPENRDPAPDEVARCAPYLKRQIELVQPRVILAVGRFAAQSLTRSDASMARLRGRAHEYEGVPVVATYHPAYLLRSPDQVRRCWEDLQLLRRAFDGPIA